MRQEEIKRFIEEQLKRRGIEDVDLVREITEMVVREKNEAYEEGYDEAVSEEIEEFGP